MMPKCSHDHSALIAPRTPMRLTRCYVASALAAQSELTLPSGASAHIAKVLRLRVGAELTLFDGRGGEYEATMLALERGGGVRVRIGAHRAQEREAPVAVTLLQCLVRAERMDLIVQKATELGAAAIVPVESRHGLVRLEAAAAERRRLRWLAIAIGACEQCGRNRIPELHAVQSFERACLDAAGALTRGTSLLLDPSGTHSLASALQALPAAPAIAPLTLLIGPEGGFGTDEIALAQYHGFVICQLGPRVLRAETAPLAALATVQALLGDFSARSVAMN
jgi:16S rRNA (uracil1498-N3)-methyltransferase